MRKPERRAFVAFCLSLLVLAASIIAIRPATGVAAAESEVGSSRRVQLEGELEILDQDFEHWSRYLYFLKLSDGTRLELHFLKHPPTNLLTGDHIRIDG